MPGIGPPPMFRKVLVANRGEIALRVLRTCREMDIRTVAVYSEADREAPHVGYADEAYPIGPASASQSYLDLEKVLGAAHTSGAEAIHPGYGFLAENRTFVKRCAEEGITFIGPPHEVMALAGDKISARRAMREAGLPISRGSDGALASAEAALEAAEAAGYPVILKASGGGGGIGMTVVRGPGEMARAFRLTQSSAQESFGRPEVFLEHFHARPRHIEFQIIADAHGHVLHLGERECSIQRRYQKLVEEAPSPALDPEARARMGRRVVEAARSIRYVNAGTFEFLLAEGRLHFNEVNARLQVEHPVTEAITGLDLVELQIRVASGEELPLSQEEVGFRGWALECRINAEDPYEGFLPSPGVVEEYSPPGGPGVRVDSALRRGSRVTTFYDPLVAKIIAHGGNRLAAVARMRRALEELTIGGLRTNIPFHLAVLGDEAFLRGDLSTRFIEERKILEALKRQKDAALLAEREVVAAVAAAFVASRGRLIHEMERGEPLPAQSEAWAAAGRRELQEGRLGVAHEALGDLRRKAL